jgi:flagella basal body P-ring formation protein FlgA
MSARAASITLKTAAAALTLAAGVFSATAGELAVVTTRVVYPGETIDAALLNEVPLVRGNRNLPPIFQDSSLLYGKVATHTILPGRLIPTNAVRDAYLVEAGKPVDAQLVAGNMVIIITAVPLEPGAAGDVVKMRNIDSGRVFTGVVMSDGTVRVGT